MQEIEVKVKVDNFGLIVQKLEALGCIISEPITQKDIIFEKKEMGPEGKNVLRIRESNGTFLFTLKRDVSGELDCIEKEMKIDDPIIMGEVLELMGYAQTVRVNKKRQKCKHKNYEICLDEVDDLGLFIEIEKMSDEDGKVVQKELVDFLESLGVDVSKQVFHGYDTLLLQKKI